MKHSANTENVLFLSRADLAVLLGPSLNMSVAEGDARTKAAKVGLSFSVLLALD